MSYTLLCTHVPNSILTLTLQSEKKKIKLCEKKPLKPLNQSLASSRR